MNWRYFCFQAENQDFSQVWALGAATSGRHHRCRSAAVPQGAGAKAEGQAHKDCEWGKHVVVLSIHHRPPLALVDNLLRI